MTKPPCKPYTGKDTLTVSPSWPECGPPTATVPVPATALLVALGVAIIFRRVYREGK